MTKRYETHMKYGADNQENEYDGIVDKKKDNQYICNWHSIMRLLNQYDDRLEFLEMENLELKDAFVSQTHLIHSLNKRIGHLETLLELSDWKKELEEVYKYEEL